MSCDPQDGSERRLLQQPHARIKYKINQLSIYEEDLTHLYSSSSLIHLVVRERDPQR